MRRRGAPKACFEYFIVVASLWANGDREQLMLFGRATCAPSSRPESSLFKVVFLLVMCAPLAQVELLCYVAGRRREQPTLFAVILGDMSSKATTIIIERAHLVLGS